MKRFLLFASVALGVTTLSNAEGVEDSSHSANLTLEWYASPAELGGGYDARAGIGTQGKFYVVKHKDGVYVFDKEGLKSKIPCSNAWVSLNCDDAGHVYFRNDKPGFPGPEGAGWFVTTDAQFSVIDVATDKIIKADVPIVGGGKCRFDALPHIPGDMTKDFFELSAPVNATAHRVYNWLYSSLDDVNTFEEINIEDYFNAAPFPGDASYINTLASAQHYTEDHMAILPNPNYTFAFAGCGWGNCIADMVFDEDRYTYVFTGKFFNTPNHSGVGGFHIFEYAGQQYIVYPTGQPEANQPSADGFAVMKVQFVDTPQNSLPITQEDLESTTAIKFGTPTLASGNNWRGINVEPVEGKDGLFTIYFYSPGASMQVWTLDLTDASIVDIDTDDVDAPAVYYNIQGMRVANPENGMFIQVSGNKVKKIVK